MHARGEAHRQDRAPQLSRRDAVTATGLLALATAGVTGWTRSASATSTTPGQAAAIRTTVRLASVTTVQDGGLLPRLLAPFEARTGRRVQVYIGEDVYARARAGEADLVFSHFGHTDAHAFIIEGLGQWPRTVLFNATALIMHTSDPAGVAGFTDPVAAFGRIAAVRAPFIATATPGLTYIADILWNAAGRPDKTGWYHDTGLQPQAAMRAAAQQGGYSLWGLTPFLLWQQDNPLSLRPVLYGDEMFHRIMVSVVVNPARFPRANVAGALALQDHLLRPATQALIQNHRLPGLDQPLFWPAGRDNASGLLPAPAGARPGPG
ncbi:extracellular solute-binding protein [Nonomuraea rosea]|uniref:Extracellular solute-binding protein n=1 Tax=Nonomuraea rosea TaxID=638574 RepID=A0ABP6ZTJ1_9ACTN